MLKMRWIAVVITLAILGLGADALAKKPDRGDEPSGIADADVAIVYVGGEIRTLFGGTGPMWIGDDAGSVVEVPALEVAEPSFGPSGSTSIVFVSDANGTGIYTIDDFTGGGLAKIVGTTRAQNTYPTWSNGSDTPLGEELIAYCDYDPTTQADQLYVTTLDGEVTQLTFGAADKCWPSWNPADGSQLLVCKLGGYGEMWLLDLGLDADDGSLCIQDSVDLKAGTTLEGTPVGSAAFSPSGSQVVFTAATGGSIYADVWVCELDTESVTNLTDGRMDYNCTHPCALGDGKVLFTHRAQTTRKRAVDSLWVMGADGSDLGLYGGSSSKHAQHDVSSRR